MRKELSTPIPVPTSSKVDKPLSSLTRKRFYKEVGTNANPAGGYDILLDGRTVRTPGRERLSAPGPGLAGAVAREWDAQGEHIAPEAMPLTTLLNTAIDRIAPARDAVISALLEYGNSDLVCYRAEAPEDLVLRQHRAWQPLLDDLAGQEGVALKTTTGILPVQQPAEALAGLRTVLERLSLLDLTAVQALTATLGSLVIALALHRGRLDPAEAFRMSQLDELYQEEKWGADHEALERRKALEADVAAAAEFLSLAAADQAGAEPRTGS